MSTTTISKTEQRELDRHASLVEAFGEAFGDFESSDHKLGSPESDKLAAKRDAVDVKLAAAAEKLRKRGYELKHDDSRPIAPAPQEAPMNTVEQVMNTNSTEAPSADQEAAAPAPAPAAENGDGFEWPKPASELLLEYLTENVSAERSAPNEGLPFITAGGILRIRAEHWRNWLSTKGIAAPKLEAGRPIRELGFAMKPFALPGEDRAHGFYTGDAPKGTEKLPRRILERASTGAPRAPKAGPFGRFDAEALGLLKSAVANYPKRAGGELRVKLLAELEQASAALAAAAAAEDAKDAAE